MKLVGERRAIAAAVLVFYAFAYFLVSLQAPAGWERAFGAMGGVYALGFFGLVAGYFWARWYAIGVGLSGLISAAVSMWQMGPEPVLIFVGATHAAIALSLWGNGVASLFDGQEAWRARFHMDENLLRGLNPNADFGAAGTPIVVAAVGAPKTGPEVVALIADKSRLSIDRHQLLLDAPIKTLGSFEIPVKLHPSVEASVTVRVVAAEGDEDAKGEEA